mgnify:CR=1 FL=1
MSTLDINHFLERLLPLDTRHFFTWTGNEKTYRVIFSDGQEHENVTRDMLFDAAKKLEAPEEFLSGQIKKAHFKMYEQYQTSINVIHFVAEAITSLVDIDINVIKETDDNVDVMAKPATLLTTENKEAISTYVRDCYGPDEDDAEEELNEFFAKLDPNSQVPTLFYWEA